MLYVITALKAPWPEGSKVGDTIELDTVPAWAVGKCKPAPGAEPAPARDLAAELATAKAHAEALEIEVADLRIKLANATEQKPADPKAKAAK